MVHMNYIRYRRMNCFTLYKRHRHEADGRILRVQQANKFGNHAGSLRRDHWYVSLVADKK